MEDHTEQFFAKCMEVKERIEHDPRLKSVIASYVHSGAAPVMSRSGTRYIDVDGIGIKSRAITTAVKKETAIIADLWAPNVPFIFCNTCW